MRGGGDDFLVCLSYGFSTFWFEGGLYITVWQWMTCSGSCEFIDVGLVNLEIMV